MFLLIDVHVKTHKNGRLYSKAVENTDVYQSQIRSQEQNNIKFPMRIPHGSLSESIE